MNKIKKFIKSSPVLAIVLGLVIAGGVSAALLTVYVTMTGTADVEQAVIFCENDPIANDPIAHAYSLTSYAGDTHTADDCLVNRSYTTAPVKFVTSYSPDGIGITTTYWNSVTLRNKDLTTWAEINPDTNAVLKYELAADEFNYELEATGLDTETSYTLMYYADRQDRFNNWGGDHPGAKILTAITDDAGKLSLVGSKNLNKNLPHDNDWNGSADANYCTEASDKYDLCRGAKIWLVPTSDYSDKAVDWTNANKYLFETDLIVYDDTDADGEALLLGEGTLTNFFVKNAFAINMQPAVYTITSKLKPAI